MKHSVYRKFLAAYLLFGLLSILLVALFGDQLSYNYLIRTNAEALYDQASTMAATYEDEESYRKDIGSLRAELIHIGKFSDVRIWIVSSKGIIITDSGSLREGVSLPNFRPFQGGSYYIGNYGGMFDEDMLSVEFPINYNYTTPGYIMLHRPMRLVTAGSADILRAVYITSAIVFALSLIILLTFAVFVYSPLKKITEGARQYAEGNLDYKIDYGSGDEIGYLAVTLNGMSSMLDSSEQSKRDFIANVSHDFRSPLTSIKGYLQAMLDGVIPPEMYEKYIQRMIFETDRLTKLTEDLLKLNSLDTKMILKKSRFDINRTIRDVCAMNENSCQEKRIRFELMFENEAEMVYADYGRIQQVLYNLIDNAIKFSNPDSVIYISTSAKARKVYTSVKDTGIGIPKASIKKIWDRFYKTDLSRGKDKKGTGLGLAIVKEIIQAHDENIDVVSTEKIGTEFIFSLPMDDASES